MRVGVIGGGIGGLASAHFLLKHGHTPVVLEASDRLGGLGTHFEHAGTKLDCFYHVILDSDSALLALIAELDLSERLVWSETGMGFYIGGVLYPFNTPLDLLKFGALSLPDRLRTGFGALYITTIKKNGLDLDNVLASEWLLRLFGRRVFERIWDPLLRAKFGDRCRTVPAYWIWNLLNREKNGGQEVKGYLQGGYEALSETLRQTIVRRGGEVRLHSRVEAVETQGTTVRLVINGSQERVDAAICTLPPPLLARLATGPLAAAVPIPDLQYQGVVNAVVLSRRRLERFYWTVVVNPSFPFQGIVETTHVVPSASIGDRHLIYLMNYCDAASELYNQSEAVVKRQAIEGLRALYPRFSAADVEAIYVFRAPYVEPVWTLGYLQRRPGTRIGDTRVYLSSTAQAYPRVTAWNTSVGHAEETVATLVADLSESRKEALYKAA